MMTDISKEAVERACNSLNEEAQGLGFGRHLHADMMTALYARVEELEARDVASEDQVKVKPIVWYDKPDGQEVRIGRADNGDAYSVKFDFGTWGYTNRRYGDGFIASRLGGVSFIDEDDAISGANEDHELHILSALDISPARPVTVQEAAKVLLDAMDVDGPFEPFMDAADAMISDSKKGLGPIPMLGSALRALSETDT